MTNTPRRIWTDFSTDPNEVLSFISATNDGGQEYVHISDYTAMKEERDTVNREVDCLLRAHDACLKELERLGATFTLELFGAMPSNKTGDT